MSGPGTVTPVPGQLPAWTAACPAAAALAARILSTQGVDRLLAIQALKHHIREEAMADAEALHHVRSVPPFINALRQL